LQSQRKKLFTATALSFALALSMPLASYGSKGGVERPKNTFTVGMTFKADGLDRICSGALIAATIVVTAGHCVYDKNGAVGTDYYFTKPGVALDAPIDPTAKKIKILKAFSKPGFSVNTPGLPDDITFIQLDSPLATSGFIRVASHAEVATLKDNEIAKGYGFGAVFETGAKYAIYPREYHIHWQASKEVPPTMIRLNSDEATACVGDSGGPITTVLPSGEEILLAVMSGAARVVDDCGTVDSEGNYTMQASVVETYISLIKDVVTTPTPKPTPTPTKKIIKINCYKGKIKKVVSGTNPKCPKGYVKRK
jgi:secreted trypsin-like serine protease